MANKALEGMGLSKFHTISLLATPQAIKTSAGLLHALWITNKATTVLFVKLWDLAAAPTVGTDVPDIVVGIPGNASDNILAILACGGRGIYFANGIYIAAVTTVANAGTTAPAANDLVVNAFYK